MILKMATHRVKTKMRIEIEDAEGRDSADEIAFTAKTQLPG
jgi:hypothetical protein